MQSLINVPKHLIILLQNSFSKKKAVAKILNIRKQIHNKEGNQIKIDIDPTYLIREKTLFIFIAD